MASTLLDSLLGEIVRLGGEALVMRVGEKPCVLAKSSEDPFRGPVDWGRIELSPRALTNDALIGMLGQMLSFDERRALYEAGTLQLEVALAGPPARRFVLEAARGKEDVRLEIRPVGAARAMWETPPPFDAGFAVDDEPPLIIDSSPDDAPEEVPDFDIELLADVEPEPPAEPPPTGAVVIPHARPQRPPPTPPVVERSDAAIVDVLRVAASRGATRLHISPGARPTACVEGAMVTLGTEPVLSAADLHRFTLEFRPAAAFEQTTWSCTIPDLGHLTCVGFDDGVDAGLVLHFPASVRSADDLELEPAIRALADEADGLIVIAGPRSGGKSTLVHALIDLVNRSRTDYLVTIESGIRVRHAKHQAIVSQRERPGGGEAVAAAARAALREGPDVLVIDDLRSPDAVDAALDGARGGRLIIGSLAAQSATDAVARLIEGFVTPRRPQVRALLASSLRAVVAQVLVDRIGGGLVAAREVLLNGPAVAPLIADGATWYLTPAIEAGRTRGMKTMADSLSSLVRRGLVDIPAACRSAPDRDALVAALQRDGVDVTTIERGA